MTDNWGVQASYKFGVNQQNMLNVRAEDADTLKIQLDGLAHGDVVTSLTHLGEVLVAGSALTPVTSAAAPAPVAPQVPQQPQAASRPQAPTCPHGTRVFRSGVGNNSKPWAAYFCPAPKGDPGACAPDWQRA